VGTRLPCVAFLRRAWEGLRTCRLCPSMLRHTLPEKGLEEVDIQVDIMDCLRLDVTASLGTAGFCMGPRSLTLMTHPFFSSCSAHPNNMYCFFRCFAYLLGMLSGQQDKSQTKKVQSIPARSPFNLANDLFVKDTILIIHRFQHGALSMLQRPTAKYEFKPGTANLQDH